VAERARRAADNIDRIADAATGPARPIERLEGPLQLCDMIHHDVQEVADWIERRREVEPSTALLNRVNAILSALDKPPRKHRGVLVLSLFPAARNVAESLRNWASDIEWEDEQRRQARTVTANGANAPPARSLNETERRILARCRRKAHKGERIANWLGLSYGHVRRVLGRLVREGRLRNTAEGGYRTV
jgi:hypothetical protein